MSYQNILCQKENSICTITINRPEKLNALNKSTIEELNKALVDADKDASIRALIITGTGEKAFVAGADIAEFANFDVAQGKALSEEGQKKLFDVVEHLSKPAIAAINGFALGGGLELAMACHMRIASSNAKLGLPEVTLGLIPGYGGTQRLAQLIGKGHAFEMITTAQMIDAEKAQRLGLVNQVVAFAQLMEHCLQLAEKIKKNSPNAIKNAIYAINKGFESSKTGYQAEMDAFGKCFGTDDFKEGTAAFLERRKPAFS